MAYVAITSLVLVAGLGKVDHAGAYLMIHLGALVGIALLIHIPRRGNILLQFVRDTYPLWALPVLYKEVGVLNRCLWSRTFDSVVLGWEKAVFGLYPSLHLIEWIPNRFVNEFLHFSYLSYYILVPILGLWLYLRGRAELCRVFATTIMLTFGICYLTFIAFPVAGPYYVLPKLANDAGIFPPIVHKLLDGGASRGAAFPSSHVAAAVSVFWMAVRFEKPLIPLVGPLCAGIFFGTVYGGFHYAVDAIAGLLLGSGVALVGPSVHSWLLRRSRLRPLKIRFPHRFPEIVSALRRSRRAAPADRAASGQIVEP
jgi:membrane-associated phospholipid phosphatase